MTGRCEIRVQGQDFDVGDEVRRIQRTSPQIGAIASFVGLVRDVNEDRCVGSMYLEHYPGMTERAIEAIVAQARQRWDLHAVTVIHRVGPLAPTDQIVLVVVGSGHRREAFEACAFIMDFLKTRAPLWKKESTVQGEFWVDARQCDHHAAGRWSK